MRQLTSSFSSGCHQVRLHPSGSRSGIPLQPPQLRRTNRSPDPRPCPRSRIAALWPRLPVLEGEHACFTEIIHRQKLPQRGAGAPAGHTLCVGLGRIVEMADQGHSTWLFSWCCFHGDSCRPAHTDWGATASLREGCAYAEGFAYRLMASKPCCRRSASHSLMPVILAIAYHSLVGSSGTVSSASSRIGCSANLG